MKTPKRAKGAKTTKIRPKTKKITSRPAVLSAKVTRLEDEVKDLKTINEGLRNVLQRNTYVHLESQSKILDLKAETNYLLKEIYAAN